MLKKTLSILLSILFLLTALPLGAVTATATGTARIYGTLSQSTVTAGQEFTLTVYIADNPGLSGWLVETAYDETAFELIDMSAGTAFSKGNISLHPNRKPAVSIYADFINPDVTSNGSIYSCTFRVKDNAVPGNYTFALGTNDPDNFSNCNFDVVPVEFEGTTITVVESYGGDFNSDNKVNVKDLGLLQQYLYGWDVEINDTPADVNNDGKINVRDIGLFQQWLNNFDVSLKPLSPPEEDMVGYPAGSVTDGTSPYVYAVADKTIVQPGYEVSVTISIANNPGLAGWNVGMLFDESVFEVVDLVKGDAFISSSVSFGPKTNPVYATYFNFLDWDVTTNGTLYTVRLKVKDTAPYGTHDILLGTRNDDLDNFSNQNFDTVHVAFEGTTITVMSPCDAGMHTASEGVVTTVPTCGEEGEMTYVCELCGTTFTEIIPATGMHIYDNACDDTCNVCGVRRWVGDHVYDNACDTTCNACAASRTAPHSYTNACDRDCNGCGITRVPPHVQRYDCATSCYSCGAVVAATAQHTYSYICDAYCNACSEYRSDITHTYSDPCDMDCNVCGITRTPIHQYDNVCDLDCNLCGAVRYVEGHAYDGDSDPICNNCGTIREVTVVPEDAPAFVVDDVKACYGKTFTVAIRTRNNPGVVSYRLNVHYDSDLLELVSAEEGAFAGITFGPTTANPFTMTWCDTVHPDNTSDDVVVYLTFRAKEGVDPTETSISLTYDLDDVYNTAWESVYFYPVCGTVQLTTVEMGDMNNDGKVNARDLGLLQQYLNGWNVDIVLEACDVDANGKINTRDMALFQRYLNGWDVELGVPQ